MNLFHALSKFKNGVLIESRGHGGKVDAFLGWMLSPLSLALETAVSCDIVEL